MVVNQIKAAQSKQNKSTNSSQNKEQGFRDLFEDELKIFIGQKKR